MKQYDPREGADARTGPAKMQLSRCSAGNWKHVKLEMERRIDFLRFSSFSNSINVRLSVSICKNVPRRPRPGKINSVHPIVPQRNKESCWRILSATTITKQTCRTCFFSFFFFSLSHETIWWENSTRVIEFERSYFSRVNRISREWILYIVYS